jgi:uncharacterized tellurite resistance protein B-like protein
LAQRHVETLIGRLITDEELRISFLRNPEAALRQLCERGFELSTTELAALVSTNREMWQQAADLLDPRLQKASLERHFDRQERENHG